MPSICSIAIASTRQPCSRRLPKPRHERLWRLLNPLTLTLLLLMGMSADALASTATERSKQKRIAESERAALRQKLSILKRDIGKTETAKDHAADALADSEAAISDANRALRDLAKEQAATVARLQSLSKEHAELTRKTDEQNQQLAALLRAQYVDGNENRLKLLLSGDNPNRINRDLQYMGYVSQAHAELIETLRANLQAVEENRAAEQNAKNELDEIAREQRQQKTLLETEKSKRTHLLTQLSSKLSAQRRQAGNIQRDEQRLSGLVDRLAKLMEQQRKAERAEAKRRQQAARAKAEQRKRQLVQKRSSSGRVTPGPDAIDDDENPGKVLARNELTPQADVQSAQSFKALRGRLRLPVVGDLMARYGSKRGDGPTWKGLFIRAREGAEVKSVANGQVIFAEWLRGFGNLIIVDHGGQYMTVYGNNQAVLKQAGDAVKAGDVIASAGNSGGNEESGLYFEMRHRGQTFDPLGWVTIR